MNCKNMVDEQKKNGEMKDYIYISTESVAIHFNHTVCLFFASAGAFLSGKTYL